jgi:predicted nucleic acid-binding protein
MQGSPVLLDTDTLSEISRGNPVVSARAQAYLIEFGRFTISAVTVFERMRGYRQAIRLGKPYERQMQAFQALAKTCIVLPFDADAADVAATIWSASSRAQRQHLGNILIAAIAVARQIPLATRNKRDFEQLSTSSSVDLSVIDWASSRQRSVRR